MALRWILYDEAVAWIESELGTPRQRANSPENLIPELLSPELRGTPLCEDAGSFCFKEGILPVRRTKLD